MRDRIVGPDWCSVAEGQLFRLMIRRMSHFIDSYTSYLHCSNRPKDKKMEDCEIKSGPASNETRRDSTKCTPLTIRFFHQALKTPATD